MRRAAFAVVSLAVMGVVIWFAPGRSEKPAGPRRHWVKIVFGADGKEAAWDGRLTVTGGRALDLVEWAFEERDQVEPKTFSWKITTGIPPQARVTQAEPMRGILVEMEVSDQTAIQVETKQGNFTCKLSELRPGRPTPVLDGRATVEPLGTAAPVAQSETDDDFASIAVDARGHRHVLWITYDQKEKCNRLLVRDLDEANRRPEPVALGKEFASAQLFAMKGELRAVWCAPGGEGDWDVYTATRQERGWHSERLTTAKGTDFHLAAGQGPDGSLWLAWQSFRNGQGDVYARHLKDGRWWPTDIPVATGPANEWQPAVSVDAKGRAWIAYDSYENGSYDVFLTSVTVEGEKHQVGGRVAIAQGEDFEAHASVLADGDRVWVVYDAAGPNWGKDFRNGPTEEKGKYAEPLHASRRLELRCVIDGKVHRPKALLPQQQPPRPIPNIARKPQTKPSRFYEYPQLAKDGDGRLWLFFRLCRQGYCPHPPKGIDWNIHATTHTEKGWLEPVQLPRSQGRQDQRVAFAVGPDKLLHCVWSDGNRFAAVDRKYVVYHGSLPPVRERAAELPLEPAPAPQPGKPDPAPQVPWVVRRDGKEYRVYFGDLHRHTNISRCSPTIDGCLTDAHRYALDAAELDFLAVTDHSRDVDPFAWWRTQQAADLFHIPGRYVPIYGYERSNLAAGGGHRNVFFLKRGQDVNPSDHWYIGRGQKPPDRRPDTTLYPWLKEQERGGAVTIAHTPEYDRKAERGTWTYHDPQVEPVAEIYQSFRRSYERPDKGVAEEAALWYALQRGHKLGFIASSDHLATHTSYACVWAAAKTREAIFEGLQARRTYAATDRIGLDVRIGDALMGEQVKVSDKAVTLTIRALGTEAIEEIQIVRSGKVLTTLRPNKREVEVRHSDLEPLRGESYYYVRLVQRDGALAWGSPIWVVRE